MAKNWGIYMAARSGCRPSRPDRERAEELFNSLGRYEGAPEVVVELANLCLQKNRCFSILEIHDSNAEKGRFRIVRSQCS